VKPLDKAWLLEALKGVKTILTVEENALAGGFGSSIHELLEGEPFAIRNLGIPDKFIEQGTQLKLRSLVGLTEENIADTLRTLQSARVGLSSN
jgi:1-deoxy-D-xylulose-5-phosphate synthase